MTSAADVRRFWSKVGRSGECWIWMASTQPTGYGQIKIRGRVLLAHRVAYEIANGSVPEGMQVDHICRRRACVNPQHLRAVTVKQNAENRSGATGGVSGFRGVRWDRARRKWSVCVTHMGRTLNIGRFDDLDAANAAAIGARLGVFTHNTTDRQEASA